MPKRLIFWYKTHHILSILQQSSYIKGKKGGEQHVSPTLFIISIELSNNRSIEISKIRKTYFTPPTFIRYSAICTALSAAPLRIWSPVSHRVMPLSLARSLRTRPT